MNNIIEKISNKDFCISMVFKYFNGKYTEDQVSNLLYKEISYKGMKGIRSGVVKLAEEWGGVDITNVENIKNWYKETDNYIFDLLPWNACGMFVEKMNGVLEKIDMCSPKSLIDYGGGLGISTLMIADKFPELEITYCDFKDSHQFKFFLFLRKELQIMDGIKIIDVDEFIESDKSFDVILAMDCFEHIPDLDNIIKMICNKTNNVIHDSTFETNDVQPQHVNSHGNLWFMNLMLKNNFVNVKDFQLFKRFVLQHNGRDLFIKIC